MPIIMDLNPRVMGTLAIMDVWEVQVNPKQGTSKASKSASSWPSGTSRTPGAGLFHPTVCGLGYRVQAYFQVLQQIPSFMGTILIAAG